jgi:hypothetical protein
MEFLSQESDVASIPAHPNAFLLEGTSFPLAGWDDTYWIAKAVWVDGQSDDEGFLIYADASHYLFLDQEEARAALLVLAREFQPRAQESFMHEQIDVFASD